MWQKKRKKRETGRQRTEEFSSNRDSIFDDSLQLRLALKMFNFLRYIYIYIIEKKIEKIETLTLRKHPLRIKYLEMFHHQSITKS